MNKRKTYVSLYNVETKIIDGSYVCNNCGKTPLAPRRRKWCSDECMWKFLETCSHQELRRAVFRERNYTCEKCGYSNHRIIGQATR